MDLKSRPLRHNLTETQQKLTEIYKLIYERPEGAVLTELWFLVQVLIPMVKVVDFSSLPFQWGSENTFQAMAFIDTLQVPHTLQFIIYSR